MSNSIDAMNAVLAQMRAMAAQSQAAPASPQASPAQPSSDFSTLLKASVDKVNESQQYSKSLATAFEMGDPGVQLAEVMIAGQKASIAFQAMTEVRNKLVEAYKEVMNMPV